MELNIFNSCVFYSYRHGSVQTSHISQTQQPHVATIPTGGSYAVQNKFHKGREHNYSLQLSSPSTCTVPCIYFCEREKKEGIKWILFEKQRHRYSKGRGVKPFATLEVLDSSLNSNISSGYTLGKLQLF